MITFDEISKKFELLEFFFKRASESTTGRSNHSQLSEEVEINSFHYRMRSDGLHPLKLICRENFWEIMTALKKSNRNNNYFNHRNNKKATNCRPILWYNRKTEPLHREILNFEAEPPNRSPVKCNRHDSVRINERTQKKESAQTEAKDKKNATWSLRSCIWMTRSHQDYKTSSNPKTCLAAICRDTRAQHKIVFIFIVFATETTHKTLRLKKKRN